MQEVSTFWSFMVISGFFGWVSCAFGLIFRAYDAEDNFYPKRALVWGLLIVAFYALWVVGLMKA